MTDLEKPELIEVVKKLELRVNDLLGDAAEREKKYDKSETLIRRLGVRELLNVTRKRLRRKYQEIKGKLKGDISPLITALQPKLQPPYQHLTPDALRLILVEDNEIREAGNDAAHKAFFTEEIVLAGISQEEEEPTRVTLDLIYNCHFKPDLGPPQEK